MCLNQLSRVTLQSCVPLNGARDPAVLTLACRPSIFPAPELAWTQLDGAGLGLEATP